MIGLRNLVDADGAPIEPTDAFRAYRDRLETDVPEVEARRPAMEQVFDDLEAAGVARDELTIAWDFTVISTESLTGPLLHMRDDAFDQLGDAAPAFTVDEVTEDVDNDRRVITGTFEIPLYLADDGAPGTSLNLIVDPDLPEPNGTWTAPFTLPDHRGDERPTIPVPVSSTDTGCWAPTAKPPRPVRRCSPRTTTTSCAAPT